MDEPEDPRGPTPHRPDDAGGIALLTPTPRHATVRRSLPLGTPMLVAVTLIAAVWGCATAPTQPQPGHRTEAAGRSANDPERATDRNADAPRSATAEIAARRAREMARAMSNEQDQQAADGAPNTSTSPRRDPAGGPPEVRWTDRAASAAFARSVPESAPGAEPAAPTAAGSTAPATRVPLEMSVESTASTGTPSDPATAASTRSEPGGAERAEPEMDRAELIRRALAEVQRGEDPAMQKALTAATLSLAIPDGELDPAVLDGLTLRERERVTRYHEAVRLMREAIVEQRQGLDEDAVMASLREVFGARPIEISELQLCKRVRGFGVYDPFESSAFLAGQAQKMILYVELENFASRELSPDKHEVRLTQEVVLYNASDGLAVWRQRPVEVVDHSRNARSDFFVVQMIELPARLSVGKYVLKVKIRDLHGETMHEASTPIEMVADRELLKARQIE